MTGTSDPRGILYPTRLPTFHRELAPAGLEAWVRWFWVPRWDLPPGRTSRQEVLAFPASNLVVEPDGLTLVGPTTRVSHRDLRGRGWAVGALLRPAGIASLCPDPAAIADTEVAFTAAELYHDVAAAMGQQDETAGQQRAVVTYARWVSEHLAEPDEGGLQANAMEDLIATDRTITRVEQVARHLSISSRGVQRLAQRYVGLPPLAIIRRYRLQEAAARLREDSPVTIAQVAADLGYADQAHLAADFRRVLGYSPNTYRRESGTRT